MSAAGTVGWFGKTFGWSGTRQEWLTLLGGFGWLVGAALLAAAAGRLTTGEAVLLAGVWLLVLGLLARRAVGELFGPVFFYEVVRIARQRNTAILRAFYVLCLGLTLGVMYYEWLVDMGYYRKASFTVRTGALAEFATSFFQVFVVVQFLVVVFLTPVYVAGAIAVEKERKTLEFLLATDLRNSEIVFGKVAARVLTLLMYVFAGLPIVAVLQLFGGIDPEMLLAAFAATVITVVGLSAVSIWLSTMMRRARDAIVLSYLLILVYYVASFPLALYVNFFPFTGWWNTPVDLGLFKLGFNDLCWALASGNPLFSIFLLESGRRFGGTYTLGELLGQFALFWAVAGGLFLGYAILRLRAVTLAQTYGAPPGTRTRRKRVTTPDGGTGTVAVNVLTRSYPPVGDNPVFWREVFVETGARTGCLWRVIVALIVGVTFLPFGLIVYFGFFDPFSRTLSWREFAEEVNAWVRGATGVVGTLLFFAAAVRGAGAISGERDKDTWVSLISAPLSADAILWGKWWGCVLGQRRVFLVLAVVWSIGLAVGAVHPVAVPFLLLQSAVYVSAFGWIGLYCSITARNTLTASVRAFFAALFFAGGFWLLVGLCCAFPLSLLEVRGREAESVFHLFAGLTPPWVYGWTPVRSLTHREMEPFDFDAKTGLGVLSVVIGTAVWIAFNVVLATACLRKFRQVTNREPAFLPEEKRLRASVQVRP